MGSRQAIDRLFKEGKTFRGTHVRLVFRRVDQGPRQVLFVAGRRVGNAVQRNRAKRRMREAYRRVVRGLAPRPIHLAWVARASCARTGMREIRDDMGRALAKTGLLRSGTEWDAGADGSRSGESET